MNIPIRTLSIVGLVAGLAASAQASTTLITPTSAIASSGVSGREGANAINGREMSVTGDPNVYSNWSMNPSSDDYTKDDGWIASNNSFVHGPWLIVDLGGTYDLDTISIWNFNPAGGTASAYNRSSVDVNVFYATTGIGENTEGSKQSFDSDVWTTLDSNHTLSTNTSPVTITSPNGLFDALDVTARYVAIEVLSVASGNTADRRYAA